MTISIQYATLIAAADKADTATVRPYFPAGMQVFAGCPPGPLKFVLTIDPDGHTELSLAINGKAKSTARVPTAAMLDAFKRRYGIPDGCQGILLRSGVVHYVLVDKGPQKPDTEDSPAGG